MIPCFAESPNVGFVDFSSSDTIFIHNGLSHTKGMQRLDKHSAFGGIDVPNRRLLRSLAGIAFQKERQAAKSSVYHHDECSKLVRCL